MSREQSLYSFIGLCSATDEEREIYTAIYVLTIFISENASKLRLVVETKYGGNVCNAFAVIFPQSYQHYLTHTCAGNLLFNEDL